MVKFTYGNMKLKELAKHMGYSYPQVVSFDLPAGWSCPKADICKTFADMSTGKQNQVGRIKCYASKAEGYAPTCRKLRWNNFIELINCKKDIKAMADLLNKNLPKNVKIVRIHSSGDFFIKEYFLAWLRVARNNPNIIFYGYTKILEFANWKNKPANFKLQYSYGSKDDGRWNMLKNKPATTFIREYKGQYSEYKKLCGTKEKSHEDYYAIINNRNFVLSIH